MREILFRGKRIDNGEWLEGYYGFDDNKPLIAINKANGINGYFVAAETVEQFTGLSDKNGKKIFESDIVESILYGDMYIRGVVKYMDARYMIVFKDRYYLDMFAEAKYSILGNIHDNPELLEANNEANMD